MYGDFKDLDAEGFSKVAQRAEELRLAIMELAESAAAGGGSDG